MAEGWSPEAYARFSSHRTAPFDDLLALVSPARGGTLLDLGCGTGVLTSKAHDHLAVRSTLGLDSSAAMLSAETPKREGLRFEQQDISTTLPTTQFDRVISNSAFNWIHEHRAYFPKVLGLIAPGGELAVQMPSNPDSPFSQCALEVAARFSNELNGFRYLSPVQSPDFYAELLARDERVVASKVGTWRYPQLHASADGIVQFAQGGLLSAYRALLRPDDFERFTREYRAALFRALGEGPVFFAFRRVFVFARVRS